MRVQSSEFRAGSAECGVRSSGWRRRIASGFILTAVFVCLSAAPAFAQDDMLKFIEEKQAELKQREENVKRDEERVATMKREVEERIAQYHKLLARLEEVLKQVEQEKDAKIESLVKAYEAMPAEDAAARITALDRETALLIMSRMKSKKAGAVMAAMPASKAAQITRGLAALEKAAR